MATLISAERLRELLRYDPGTGDFTCLVDRGKAKIGTVAGTINPEGYVIIEIDHRSYRAHRLAWLYMTGEWPKGQVDHRDGSRAYNAWSNLREATQTQQNGNRGVDRRNTSGLKGVSWHKHSQRWRATILFEGRCRHLGYFDEKAVAHEAYCTAARQLFGEFAETKRQAEHRV